MKHKTQQGKKPVTSPCKACRRRIRLELLDESFLCAACRNDAATRSMSGKSQR